MKLLGTVALTAAIVMAGASCGFAQAPSTGTPSAAGTPPAAAKSAKPTSAEKAVISKACSEQADAKKLHGKERKKFRSQCKRSGGKPS